MHQLAHKSAWYAALIATGIYAWRRGGVDERLAAGTLLASTLMVTFLFPHVAGANAVHNGILFSLVAIVFLGIALNTRAWWPMWAAPFQLISAAAIVVVAADPSLRPMAAYVDSVAWDYLTLVAIALGIRLEVAPRLPARAAMTANSSTP